MNSTERVKTLERPADQPALARAMRIFSDREPDLASQAQDALEFLLEPLVTSPWPEVAWRFSQLTGDGFPVDLSFTSLDPAIRYACEAAGPETPEADRLELVSERLSRLGMSQPDEVVMAALHRIQKAGVLGFGAWAGGRHSHAGDLFKIYVEVPREAAAEAGRLAGTFLSPDMRLPGRETRLRLVGYEPDTERLEFYYQSLQPEPWELSRLLKEIGCVDQGQPLLHLLEAASGVPIEALLGNAEAGFSLSTSPGGQTAFSLFIASRSLFGGDGRARKRLLDLAARREWDLGVYAAISQPLEDRSDWRTYHSSIAFVVAPQIQPFIQVGLRPPG